MISDCTPSYQHRVYQLFLSWWRYFLAVFVGTVFCLQLPFVVQKNATECIVMRVKKKGEHAHRVHANARKRMFEHVFKHTFAQKLCMPFACCVGH